MTVTLEESIRKRTHDNPLSWLVSRQTFWVSCAAVVAFVALSLMSDAFATQQNLFNVTRNFAFVGIIALGMTAVIITGGIDLSVGATLVLCGMVIGMSMNVGTPFWIAVALALGMLSLWRSQGQVWSNNAGVYKFGPHQADIFWLGGGSIYGIANPVIALVLLTAITGFCLRWTRWGCHIFAVGGNEKAARLTGVPVRRIKLSVYLFSALMSGIAGILTAGWLGGVTQNLGEQKELSVIAATVIGGANLMGGSGTAIGGVVGAALIEIIRNSLAMLQISTFWQGTFIGGCILIAVALDRVKALRQSED